MEPHMFFSTRAVRKILDMEYSLEHDANIELGAHDVLSGVRTSIAKGTGYKVPLRALRDELLRTYLSRSEEKEQRLEIVFQVFDKLIEKCSRSGGNVAEDTIILGEIRAKLYKMVVGETWEPFTELRVMALRRIHKHMVRERREAEGDHGGVRGTLSPAPGVNALAPPLKLKLSGPDLSSWRSTFKSLHHVPGTRLLPLLEHVLELLNEGDVGEACSTWWQYQPPDIVDNTVHEDSGVEEDQELEKVPLVPSRDLSADIGDTLQWRRQSSPDEAQLTSTVYPDDPNHEGEVLSSESSDGDEDDEDDDGAGSDGHGFEELSSSDVDPCDAPGSEPHGTWLDTDSSPTHMANGI